MVQFEYKPFTKIVVHELNEFDNNRFFEDLVRMSLAQNSQIEPVANWVDGIAFLIYPMPETDEITNERLNGIVHYGMVSFTKLDYKPRYDLKFSNQEYHVVLRKAESTPIFADLVRWIKTDPHKSSDKS